MSRTALLKVVDGVREFVRAINSNIVRQISALFEVGTLGSFLTISSTRGIDNAIFTWFISTRLYNILRSRESVLLVIREGRMRAAGLFARARMRSSTRFLVAIYLSKECRQKKLGHTCNSSC
jgi:hypothetical protein